MGRPHATYGKKVLEFKPLGALAGRPADKLGK